MVVGDGNGANLNLWTQLRDGREDRGSLRAVGHTVGSVLDVAAGKNFTVREQDRRANVEVGVRRVGVLHDLCRSLLQSLSRSGGQVCVAHREKQVRRPNRAPL